MLILGVFLMAAAAFFGYPLLSNPRMQLRTYTGKATAGISLGLGLLGVLLLLIGLFA